MAHLGRGHDRLLNDYIISTLLVIVQSHTFIAALQMEAFDYFKFSIN